MWNIFGLRKPTTNGVGGSAVPDADRLEEYRRYLRAYRGYRSGAYDTNATTKQRAAANRKLRFNFNRPIVNLGAAFLAAKPLSWKVDGNEAASKAAFDIWDRSGSDRAFLRAARVAGIYGDMVGLATQDAEGRPRIEFVNPDICFPTFDGADASHLVELEISWETEDRQGRQVTHREFYTENGREVYLDRSDTPDPEQSQAWDHLPAAWIRNTDIQGLPFGLSDLEGVVELVEEYDHIASKRGQMIDYYAAPSIVCEGIKRTDVQKDISTMYFPPEGSKVYFLEWNGTPPDVDEQLSRIKADLSEISQVPRVAYGDQDGGATVTGVALRILYGPLLAKTNDKRACWGPSLEYLMWLCLQAEGHQVELDAVNVKWQTPLPEDPGVKVEEEAAAVGAGLRSVETAMAALGTEDPLAELVKVQRDRRFATLKELADAGVDFHSAAQIAGFVPAEVAVLGRTDTVSTIEQ